MFKRISITEAKRMMDESSVQVVDVRDPLSYQAGHIPGAINLTNESIKTFMDSASKTQPVLVCCYHGNSSQSAAAFLNEQGFADTYSIDGGFETWKLQFPVER